MLLLMKLLKHGSSLRSKCSNNSRISFMFNFTIFCYPPYHSIIIQFSLTNKNITWNTTFQDVISHLPSLVHNSTKQALQLQFSQQKGHSHATSSSNRNGYLHWHKHRHNLKHQQMLALILANAPILPQNYPCI